MLLASRKIRISSPICHHLVLAFMHILVILQRSPICISSVLPTLEMCLKNFFPHHTTRTAPSSRSIARFSRKSRNAKKKTNPAGLTKKFKKKKKHIAKMDPVMKRMRDLLTDHLSYSGNKHVCHLVNISCIFRISLCVVSLKRRRRSRQFSCTLYI